MRAAGAEKSCGSPLMNDQKEKYTKMRAAGAEKFCGSPLIKPAAKEISPVEKKHDFFCF